MRYIRILILYDKQNALVRSGRFSFSYKENFARGVWKLLLFIRDFGIMSKKCRKNEVFYGYG